MAKFTPKNLKSGLADVDSLNENFDNLETLSDTWLSRDGTSPNSMLTDFDMNSKRILNLPQPQDAIDPVRLKDIGNAFLVDDTVVIFPQSETITLTAGQLTVTFVIFDTDFSSFVINGTNVDVGKLLLGIDYSVVTSTSILLTKSYPAGTKITLQRNTTNGVAPNVIAINVSYDNGASGLTAANVQAAIDEVVATPVVVSAANVTYSNATSGLTATDVQDAVDEIISDIDTIISIPFTVVSTNTVAVNGTRVAVDTSSAVITITLPGSPSTGDYVKIVDYSGTFLINNCIVARNGKKIMGIAADMNLNTNFLSVEMNFIDDTRGWLIV